METPDWVADAVFYEIFPDRFARSARPPAGWDPSVFEDWDAPPAHRAYKGGDLWGAASLLPHLEALGVTALYLAPVHAAPTHHRYKPLDHLRADPLLGGDAAFDAFVAAARARGLRVVLDGVFSHVGVGFPPFADVIEYGAASPWASWFRIEGWPIAPFDSSRRANYACFEGNRSMPQLAHGNPAVRAYLFDVAERWLRRGASGWRLDAPEAIDAVDGGRFWRELRARLTAVDPEVYLVGECWTDATARLDGSGWHAATNHPLAGAIRAFAAGPRLRHEHLHPGARPGEALDAPGLARRIAEPLDRLPHATALAQFNFINNHDLARFLTVAGEDLASVTLATVLLLTLPGAPCLFYGDEVGLAGGLPPDSRRGFPPQERWNLELLDRHRRLIALRRRVRPLRRGVWRTLAADGGLLVYERVFEDERAVVAVNASDGASRARIAPPLPPLAFGAAGTSPADGLVEVSLAPRAAAVFAV